ncbi:hypothetical protein MRX96_043731 [Rhipicephalus microplus]
MGRYGKWVRYMHNCGRPQYSPGLPGRLDHRGRARRSRLEAATLETSKCAAQFAHGYDAGKLCRSHRAAGEIVRATRSTNTLSSKGLQLERNPPLERSATCTGRSTERFKILQQAPLPSFKVPSRLGRLVCMCDTSNRSFYYVFSHTARRTVYAMNQAELEGRLRTKNLRRELRAAAICPITPPLGAAPVIAASSRLTAVTGARTSRVPCRPQPASVRSFRSVVGAYSLVPCCDSFRKTRARVGVEIDGGIRYAALFSFCAASIVRRCTRRFVCFVCAVIFGEAHASPMCACAARKTWYSSPKRYVLVPRLRGVGDVLPSLGAHTPLPFSPWLISCYGRLRAHQRMTFRFAALCERSFLQFLKLAWKSLGRLNASGQVY